MGNHSYEASCETRWDSFLGTYLSYLNAADGYVEGVVADISDLKQEAALQILKQNWWALFSHSRSAVYLQC